MRGSINIKEYTVVEGKRKRTVVRRTAAVKVERVVEESTVVEGKRRLTAHCCETV